jgi:hypothetical protein
VNHFSRLSKSWTGKVEEALSRVEKIFGKLNLTGFENLSGLLSSWPHSFSALAGVITRKPGVTLSSVRIMAQKCKIA